MEYNIKDWAAAAGIRAVKTFFQNLLICLPVGVSIEQMGWVGAIGIAAGAASLSLITSLAGLPEVADGASVAKIAGNDEIKGQHAKKDDE